MKLNIITFSLLFLCVGLLSSCTTGPQKNSSRLPKYKIGLQLFSVRDAMAEDPKGTLIALKEMGYEDFETYGFDPETGTIYGYTVAAFKALLDELGLTVTSGHYGFTGLMEASPAEVSAYVEKCIAAAKILESPYLTWPFVLEEYRNPAGFERLATLLNQIGQQVTEAGLGFAYHNHGYEFEDWEGTTGFDIILAKTNPQWVKLQLDMYWAVHSGRTPQELVAAQPGRFVMWHIKDMHKESRDYTEMGQGSIDYTSMLPDPKTSGLQYYYIEQGGNFALSSMESAKTSIRYVKENLLDQL